MVLDVRKEPCRRNGSARPGGPGQGVQEILHAGIRTARALTKPCNGLDAMGVLAPSCGEGGAAFPSFFTMVAKVL
jgi:hypothetical protein